MIRLSLTYVDVHDDDDDDDGGDDDDDDDDDGGGGVGDNDDWRLWILALFAGNGI